MLRLALALLVTACGSSDEPAPPPPTGPTTQTPEDPFERALASSGTGPRLRASGLTEDGGATEVPAAELGAARSMRVRRADGSATADVYYFEQYDTLERAGADLRDRPVPEGATRFVVANGAFLVVIVATGPDAERVATEIASRVAGEE